MGSKIGHRLDYNGVGALRGQRQKKNKKINPSTTPRPPGGSVPYISHFHVLEKTGTFTLYSTFLSIRWGRWSSSFTNTHKHSRITYHFNDLVVQNKSAIVLAAKIVGQLVSACFKQSDKNKLGAIEELIIPCILWITHVGMYA